MTFREALFAAYVAVAIVAVVRGVAMFSEAAGWIVGGVAGAAWAWLMLGGGETPP